MGARCGEQGTDGAGSRADLIFDALSKNTVTRTMTSDDCVREEVEITCGNIGPVKVNYRSTSFLVSTF